MTAIQQNPTSQRAHTQAAITYNSAGQHVAATEILKQGLERLPENFPLSLHLAIQQCRGLGVEAKTIEKLRANANSEPYQSHLYRVLEQLTKETKQDNCSELTPQLAHDVVLALLQQIESIEPDARHRQLHQLLGLLDLQEGRVCQAYERFQRSARASPLPGLIARQADQLARAGYYVEALHHIAYIADAGQDSDRGWRPLDSGIDQLLTQGTRRNIAEAWNEAGQPPATCTPLPAR